MDGPTVSGSLTTPPYLLDAATVEAGAEAVGLAGAVEAGPEAVGLAAADDAGAEVAGAEDEGTGTEDVAGLLQAMTSKLARSIIPATR